MSPDTQDNLPAFFRLGTAIQSLIDLSLEFGDGRVPAALPPEQRDLLVMIPPDGEESVATALEEETRLFGEWEIPQSDNFFALSPGIMISPQPKGKRDPHGKP
ncbi:MAG: hypothetical protein ACLQPD_35825 [Desulfomonilaceae bacterium]